MFYEPGSVRRFQAAGVFALHRDFRSVRFFDRYGRGILASFHSQCSLLREYANAEDERSRVADRFLCVERTTAESWMYKRQGSPIRVRREKARYRSRMAPARQRATGVCRKRSPVR